MAFGFMLLLLGMLVAFYERAGLWTAARLSAETNMFNLVINEGVFSIFIGWAAFLLMDTLLYSLSDYDLYV